MPKRMKHGLVRVVKKLEIFRDLTEDEAILGQRKAYDTGDLLRTPGDSGVDMLVLIMGKLHVKNDAGEIVG